MSKVVVIGGGWAGISAAYAGAMAGMDTLLVERSDMLLGTGLVGGIMNNNGRYVAAEETIFMGGGEIYEVIESVTRHKGVNFPGHRHASLYDVTRIEPSIGTCLKKAGVKIVFNCRITDVVISGQYIKAVESKGKKIYGDAFIDCTGTFGPLRNCLNYNPGCAMCIMRCPTFGPRVSIAEKAGVKEISFTESLAISGSCKLEKASLGKWLVDNLESKGVCMVPLPQYLMAENNLQIKACQQYAMKEFKENLILLDTGHVKMMTPYFDLEKLRIVPGFENALYHDPYAGGLGNSVRYSVVTPRNDGLAVKGVNNLFCAGEKTGFIVGHTEAIATGMLAGHNAARSCVNMEPLILPTSTVIGDIIAYTRVTMEKEGRLRGKYTFSGSVYFERMKKNDFYTLDRNKIRSRVKSSGCLNIFKKSL